MTGHNVGTVGMPLSCDSTLVTSTVGSVGHGVMLQSGNTLVQQSRLLQR
jgi:hypothetical protein